MFSAALASGQLGPLMCQFGLPAEAVEAANKGGKYLPLRLSATVEAEVVFSLHLKAKAFLICGARGGLSRWPWPPSGFHLPAPRSAGPSQGLGRSPHAFHFVLDVEAFAKAMQNSASPEQQEGDGKGKKEEEEDMSLD